MTLSLLLHLMQDSDVSGDIVSIIKILSFAYTGPCCWSLEKITVSGMINWPIIPVHFHIFVVVFLTHALTDSRIVSFTAEEREQLKELPNKECIL